MINSFWNICSTCPMPKEEKLNSEYKRNYVWHPQYKPLAQDVVSCAPQSIVKEIGIQRRKQYPELAYRNNEVIRHDLSHHSKDAADLRARSEERDMGLASKSGPRSRSAEPGSSHYHQKSIMVQSFPPITSGRVAVLPEADEFPIISENPSETTEYKSQFAWPKKTEGEIPCTARKSVSMGIIKSADEPDMSVPKFKAAAIHRQCTKKKEATIPDKKPQDSKKKVKTEYKAKYKPFTSYVYVDGQWKKTSRLLKVPEKPVETHEEPWFVEVVERLQKANEYRWRGHTGELLPEIYKQPPEIPPSRSKLALPELQMNVTKCHQSTSKKSDSRKRETHTDFSKEKKKDKEAKTPPALRRPKSAEPAKAKEAVKHKRPATTPPAKPSAHVLPTRRKPIKDDEVDKKPKARTPSLKKLKEEPAKVASSVSRKTENPSSLPQGSGGKVWLQADQPVSEPKEGDDASVRKHSDAVRPSSLSPIAKPVPPQQEQPQKVFNDVEAKEEPSSAETKSAVPYSSVVPLTHVRTPEEVTGVKSPDPENWTVPIESSEKLQWSGVNTSDAPMRLKKTEEISENLSKLPTDESVPINTGSQESVPSSSKLTSTNVLDRARSRLDQFWGKNK
ncbi:triadin-like [Uloborus diversus]|uniref:triadin-like n=1 Tax=Uloborus diversus TaxID=327109 RepID=UPI00240A02B2|nr:triadin-like [Uloborus diversus]